VWPTTRQSVRRRFNLNVSDDQLTELRAAGYANAEIIEIVLAVTLNPFTNYVNEVAQTDIDFPVVYLQRAAA